MQLFHFLFQVLEAPLADRKKYHRPLKMTHMDLAQIMTILHFLGIHTNPDAVEHQFNRRLIQVECWRRLGSKPLPATEDVLRRGGSPVESHRTVG
jgi:hypothetical protein